jgi:hypothetical protein
VQLRSVTDQSYTATDGWLAAHLMTQINCMGYLTGNGFKGNSIIKEGG